MRPGGLQARGGVCCRAASRLTRARGSRPHTIAAPTQIGALVDAARAGDDAAWTQLVNHYDRMLRCIARS